MARFLVVKPSSHILFLPRKQNDELDFYELTEVVLLEAEHTNTYSIRIVLNVVSDSYRKNKKPVKFH